MVYEHSHNKGCRQQKEIEPSPESTLSVNLCVNQHANQNHSGDQHKSAGKGGFRLLFRIGRLENIRVGFIERIGVWKELVIECIKGGTISRYRLGILCQNMHISRRLRASFEFA